MHTFFFPAKQIQGLDINLLAHGEEVRLVAADVVPEPGEAVAGTDGEGGTGQAISTVGLSWCPVLDLRAGRLATWKGQRKQYTIMQANQYLNDN